MPLSEHEQRLLDQIERALYDEDPKFASTVRSTDLRTHMRRRMIRAAGVFVVGLILLPVGVLTKPIVGIIGFLVMIVAMVLAMSAYRRLGTGASHGSASGSGGSGFSGGRDELSERRQRGSRRPPTADGGGGGFRGRIEERWKRRWDERGGDQR